MSSKASRPGTVSSAAAGGNSSKPVVNRKTAPVLAVKKPKPKTVVIAGAGNGGTGTGTGTGSSPPGLSALSGAAPVLPTKSQRAKERERLRLNLFQTSRNAQLQSLAKTIRNGWPSSVVSGVSGTGTGNVSVSVLTGLIPMELVELIIVYARTSRLFVTRDCL